MIPLVNPTSRPAAGPQPWLSGAVRWVVVVLALVATLDAAYMTWTSVTHGVVAGCSPTEPGGCHEVLSSKWSRAMGLPVALGGLLCYGGILALSLFAGSSAFNSNRLFGTVLASLATLAALCGLWFTGLQVFALGSFCPYCLVTHACGLVIAALVLWSALVAKGGSSAAMARSHASLAAIPGANRRTIAAAPRSAEGPSLFAAVPTAAGMLALLITVQMVFPAKTFSESKPQLSNTIDMTAAADPADATSNGELSPDAQSYTVNRVGEDEDSAAADETSEEDGTRDDDVKVAAAVEVDPDREADEVGADDEPAEEEKPKLIREVSFLGGTMKIDMYEEAVLGSPEAKYVVVELMDYTCPHCRKMHSHIQEAMERYGDQLAVVIMPVPLELECNKLVGETDPMHRGACKLAKLALAVSKTDQSKFIDFHNFLLDDVEEPPTVPKAVSRAFRLVGRKKLVGDNSSNAPEFGERLQKYIRLYQNLSTQNAANKAFGLPVQIVGDTQLSGGDVSEEEMFAAWEKATGMKPQ
jgi:uncharacterized membrane protein/thiol-disulfide isomerase/thioredoxin